MGRVLVAPKATSTRSTSRATRESWPRRAREAGPREAAPPPKKRLLEEVPEAAQVRGAEAPRPEAAGHGILAAEVVHLTLIGVREDLISGIDGFELVLVAGPATSGCSLRAFFL